MRQQLTFQNNRSIIQQGRCKRTSVQYRSNYKQNEDNMDLFLKKYEPLITSVYTNLSEGVKDFEHFVQTFVLKRTFRNTLSWSPFFHIRRFFHESKMFLKKPRSLDLIKKSFEQVTQDIDQLNDKVNVELESTNAELTTERIELQDVQRKVEQLQLALNKIYKDSAQARERHHIAKDRLYKAKSDKDIARAKYDEAHEEWQTADRVLENTWFIPVVNIFTLTSAVVSYTKTDQCKYKYAATSDDANTCHKVYLKTEQTKEKVEHEFRNHKMERERVSDAIKKRKDRIAEIKESQKLLANINVLVKQCVMKLDSIETAFKVFHIEIDDDSTLDELGRSTLLMCEALEQLAKSRSFPFLFGTQRTLTFERRYVRPLKQRAIQFRPQSSSVFDFDFTRAAVIFIMVLLSYFLLF